MAFIEINDTLDEVVAVHSDGHPADPTLLTIPRFDEGFLGLTRAEAIEKIQRDTPPGAGQTEGAG